MKLDNTLKNLNQVDVVKWSVMLIVVLLLYFQIRKAIKTLQADAETKKIANEIEPDKLSYPLNQYIAMADVLYDAMVYLGTDENTIMINMRKMNNLSDVLQLVKAFGSRNYYPFWGEKTLPQWLHEELSQSKLNELNENFKRKSINYSF